EASGGTAPVRTADIYIVAVGAAAQRRAIAIAERLRDELPAVVVELNLDGGSFKSQLKRADRSGAGYALIFGEDEIRDNVAALKPLRSGGDQISVPIECLTGTIAERMKSG
ncbi:MAG: His/Gly/Thr/Pro-type tRNA ligase C-terminal domain-containing protein, partial [Geminicoccales bacterium]